MALKTSAISNAFDYCNHKQRIHIKRLVFTLKLNGD